MEILTNPWILAIEALLHMQKLDLSIILELVKSVPDESDELGRNARELIAVRVLENLFDREIRNRSSSGVMMITRAESQTKMHVTQFCQEIVDFVILGGSRGFLGFDDEADFVELDVPSSSMQDCSLHQLKNGILEGSNPILKSLKDRSGLEVPDENGRDAIDGGVSTGMTKKRGVRRKLDFYTAEFDEILKEELDVNNLPPAKRDRNIAVSRNCEVASCKPCRIFEESRKRLKKVLLSFPKKTCELAASSCQHEQLGDSSSRTVEHIEERVNRETGPKVHSVEESKGKEDHCADASARLKYYNNTDLGTFFQLEQLIHYADSTPEDMSGKGDAQVNFSDIANGGIECALKPPAVTINIIGQCVEENACGEANDSISHSFQTNMVHATSKDNNVHGDNLEILNDGNEYHDARTDISMTKNSSLSSRGTDTQDSLGTQLLSCVKCNKGGDLLSCSSSTCPLVVHEECLGSAINFDRMGNFYCPFCAYWQSISQYLEAKKKFYLARTDLMTFHVVRTDLEEKNSSKRSRGYKKHGRVKFKT